MSRLGKISCSILALAVASGVLLACGADGLPSASARQAFERPAETSCRLSQVGTVTSYKPDGQVRGVALFLSGDGGWNLGVVDMAKALQARGIAVAGVSTPAFLKQLEAGKDKCINPNFALIALAQDFEHKLGLPRYIKPIVVGYSSGATVAYAALAQAPVGIFKGGVSLGFGPDLPGTRPWCPVSGIKPLPISKPEKGWLFAPVPHLPARWIVLQGLDDQVVSPATARSFTSRIPEAELIELPKVGHGYAVEANWMPQFLKAFAPMLEAVQANALSSSLDDLPLTPVINPAAPRTDTMAVIYSGDGGWAGLDRDLAAQLAARGIPVVGVDSLDYFWNARSPESASADLQRIIGHYGSLWHRKNTILIGYSFGSNVLPFIVGKLPGDVRAGLSRVTLLGLDAKADFQFHLSSWVDISGDNAMQTVPAADALRGLPLQCIRGADETGSACLQIAGGIAQQVTVPGGHHFDGNAPLLARTMVSGLDL